MWSLGPNSSLQGNCLPRFSSEYKEELVGPGRFLSTSGSLKTKHTTYGGGGWGAKALTPGNWGDRKGGSSSAARKRSGVSLQLWYLEERLVNKDVCVCVCMCVGVAAGERNSGERCRASGVTGLRRAGAPTTTTTSPTPMLLSAHNLLLPREGISFPTPSQVENLAHTAWV